jgi:hypothetical protein
LLRAIDGYAGREVIGIAFHRGNRRPDIRDRPQRVNT